MCVESYSAITHYSTRPRPRPVGRLRFIKGDGENREGYSASARAPHFAGEQIARTAENPNNCTKDQKEGRPVKPAPCALRVCAMACAHRAPLRAVCHLSYCVGEYTLLHCTTVPREMPRHEATSGASRLASRQQRSFAGATVGRPSMTELAPFRLSVRSIWYLCAHLDAFRENVQEPEI